MTEEGDEDDDGDAADDGVGGVALHEPVEGAANGGKDETGRRQEQVGPHALPVVVRLRVDSH